MRKIFAFAVLGALLMAGHAAQADTFVWKDQKGGYTMSFPDVWRIQTDDVGYTRLRIAGPLAEDRTTCRLQVRPDGRIQIYPKELTGEAVMEKLDHEYWDNTVAEFHDAKINNFYAPASLGSKGDATGVQFSYNDGKGDAKSHMQAIAISSIYGKDRFTFTCATTAATWERYNDLFLSIADSIELDSRYHPFVTGYYRNFLLDPKLILPRSKPGSDSPYVPLTWADRFTYND
jgi:hypothetical protein